MNAVNYLRPQTIEEALVALKAGKALAGGTALTPQRRQLEALVDLQSLGLDAFEVNEAGLQVGAMTRLQTFLLDGGEVPAALQEACRLEAGWNLRNMMTVGGILCVGDSRSPFLTVASALECEVRLLPGERKLGLSRFFDERVDPDFSSLIAEIRLAWPQRLAYEQVARSPADRPLVCAAAAIMALPEGGRKICLALGGWGLHPLSVWEEELPEGSQPDLEDAVRVAAESYTQADDAWASAAYRSHVAGILARRVVEEVSG